MEINKERIEKFKQHTKAVFAPYVQQIVTNEQTVLHEINLMKAIHGLIYQYTGNEDEYIKTNEIPAPWQIAYFGKKIIYHYHTMHDEEKILHSNGEEDESRIVNNLLTRLVFRLIHKRNPTFFFFTQRQSEANPNAFIDEGSEPQEGLSFSWGFLMDLYEALDTSYFEALDTWNFEDLESPEEFSENSDEK